MQLNHCLSWNTTVSERVARVLTVVCLSVASVVAVATVAVWPQSANAQTYIELPANVVSTGVGTADFTVDFTPAYQAGWVSVANDRNVTDYVRTINDSSTHCYPRAGGSSGVVNGTLTYGLNSATHQTNNQTGGSPNCASSGTYYNWYYMWTGGVPNYDCNGTQGQCYYASYYYNANSNTFSNTPTMQNVQYQSGFNATTQTRFTSLSFTGKQASVGYFLETSEIDTTRPETNPTLVRIQYAKRPDVEFSGRSESIDNSVYGTSTVTSDLTVLTNGTYDLLVTFANTGTLFGGAVPFPDSYIYATVDVSGQTITIIGDLEFYDGTTPIDEQALRDCSLTAISGCIINAFTVLFVPSTESLSELSEFNDTLSGKFPFAYLYDFQSSIGALFGDTSQSVPTFEVAFAGGTLTLLSQAQLEAVPYVPFIRTTVGFLLWVVFAFTMYRRTLNIFNPQQTI